MQTYTLSLDMDFQIYLPLIWTPPRLLDFRKIPLPLLFGSPRLLSTKEYIAAYLLFSEQDI